MKNRIITVIPFAFPKKRRLGRWDVKIPTKACASISLVFSLNGVFTVGPQGGCVFLRKICSSLSNIVIYFYLNIFSAFFVASTWKTIILGILSEPNSTDGAWLGSGKDIKNISDQIG